MTKAKRGKTKELSKKEALERGRTIIAGLYGGGNWENIVAKYEQSPASHRRDILDAIGGDRIGKDGRIDRSRLLQISRIGLRATPGVKPDFLLSQVRAVFDFCSRVDQGTGALGEVFAALLEVSTQSKNRELLDVSALDTAELAGIPEVGVALGQAIGSGRCDDVLKKTIGVWGRILGALFGARPASTGLGESEALAVLRLMSGRGPSNMPTELVLLVPWLANLAGGVPDEMAESLPFAPIPKSLMGNVTTAEARITGAMESDSPSAGTELGTSGDDRIAKESLWKTSGLYGQIQDALNRFEQLTEERKGNLVKKLQAADAQIHTLQAQAETNRDQITDLESKRQDLIARLRAAEENVARITAERDTLKQECDRWQRELAVIADSANQQVEDAKAEVRRALKSSILSHLVNLREYLGELDQSGVADAARHATTLFDEVVKILQRQGFVTQTELSRVRS